jgi:gliding motility-associated-like protein
MNRNSGLGDVVMKDSLMLGEDSVCLKITATAHCNKRDLWVIGHKKNSDKYFSFLITPNGISSTPVLSTGNWINETGRYYNHYGYMKVSPNGVKIAASFESYMDMVEVGDFDNQTGIISNIKKLTIRPTWALPQIYDSQEGPQGVEFSPSGNKLYVAANYSVLWPCCPYFTPHLYQFDLSVNNQPAIQASRVLIDSIENSGMYGMQLAPNGKIYIATGGSGLHEIGAPQNPASSCGYLRYGGPAIQGFSGTDLPNFLQSYLRFPVIATGNCQFQNISFNVLNLVGVSSIVWDFGDPASGINNTSTSFAPTHIYSGQGAYHVKAVLQNTNGCGADTIRKIVYAGQYQVNLGNDTSYCAGDSLLLKLNMHIPGAGILWSNGSRDTAITINQTGTYWVRANLGDCVASDTINITVRNLPQFTLGNDTLICGNTSVNLLPTPSYPSASYLWSNNSTSSTISVNTPGNHWLRLTDMYGCKWRDTINVSFKTLPQYNLGKDTAICTNDTLLLNATVNGASSYLWNTNANSPTIKTYLTNTYWCDVNKDGCIYRDSIDVFVKPLPNVNLGKDTTLCEDFTLLLNITNPPSSSYLWQDGSNTPTYLVTQKGRYNARVIMNGCINRDTVNIDYFLRPRFSLGADKIICSGMSFILDPNIDNVNYLWQDGSINKTYVVTQPGQYALKASNYCGATIDKVLITQGACKLYIPNAFTPNGDGNNDVFRAGLGENVTDYQLQVFNRYGQLIFESKDLSKGWDGQYGGKNQPGGTYAWIIRYKTVTNNNIEILKGTVLLLR